MSNPPACDRCRFWETVGPAAVHWGDCRRYAPRPANQAVLFGAEAISLLAEFFSQRHGLSWPPDQEGEITETSHAAMWPRTYGHHWCGEWEPTQ